MKSTKLNDEIVNVEFNDEKSVDIVWISDLHFDSKFSEWKKLKKYLIDNPKTYIIIGGDSLDVMQFKNDPRGNKSSDKYYRDDYVNAIVEDARKEIVEPFKNRILCWNRGNHDNSVIRHHNIDLLKLICRDEIVIHEYAGYIILNMTNKSRTLNYIINFIHSPETSGKRSKGSLSIDLAKAYYPSANMWIREHIHEGFIHPVNHEFLSTVSKSLVHKNKWYIQNISMKNENQGKRNGFHTEKNLPISVNGILKFNIIFDSKNGELICDSISHKLIN